MKRITKLTHAQQDRMEGHADEWIKWGLCTDPANRPLFEESVRACYRYAGLAEPKRIVWVQSPLIVALSGPIANYALSVDETVRRVVGEAVGEAVSEAVHGAVSEAVDRAVSEAVSEAVDRAVGEAVDWAVGEAVRRAVGQAVRRVVGEAVDEAIGRAVGEAVRRAVGVNWHRYMGGQFWVGGWWGGAYNSFFREVCELELPGNLWERARAYERTMQSACWWWPHTDFVIVSERPRALHLEQVRPRGWGSHRLHCATGPAVQFRDGWSVWAWHGVLVTEQIILRPETLTTEQIAKETNAQVRQVMVERIGIERVCQMFNATTQDQCGEYALLLLDLGDGRKRPYLKMRNPSVGVWHVEGVHPKCRTVQEALNWRNGLTPEQIDDIHGADWLQQGDVILKPTGATKFKSQPIQLT